MAFLDSSVGVTVVHEWGGICGCDGMCLCQELARVWFKWDRRLGDVIIVYVTRKMFVFVGLGREGDLYCGESFVRRGGVRSGLVLAGGDGYIDVSID